MRRREVLLSALLAGAAGRAAAQQGGRTPVVGVLIGLSSAPGAVGQARLAGLRQGLAELGFQPGHNLVLEPRWLEFWLKEGFGVWRFASAGLVFCGIILSRYKR